MSEESPSSAALSDPPAAPAPTPAPTAAEAVAPPEAKPAASPAPPAGAVRRRGLGRGLSALLGDDPQPMLEADGATGGGGGYAIGGGPQRLPISALIPNPVQPRRVFDDEAISDLADSIRSKGVLTPILVRPDPTERGRFQIVAGERRWRASQRAQLHEVPVLIRDLSDQETLEVALIENLQRQDLNPLEEADGFRRLMDDFGHTQEGLARVLGKSRSHVANTLRLTQLPDPIKAMLNDGRLTAGHARALLTAPDAVALAERVVTRGLNVRQTEKLAQQAAAGPRPTATTPRKPRSPGASDKDADTLALERDISNALGLAVHIEADRDGGGRLVVAYDSLAQLDEVIQRLSRPLRRRSAAGDANPEADLFADEIADLEDLVALDDATDTDGAS